MMNQIIYFHMFVQFRIPSTIYMFNVYVISIE